MLQCRPQCRHIVMDQVSTLTLKRISTPTSQICSWTQFGSIWSISQQQGHSSWPQGQWAWPHMFGNGVVSLKILKWAVKFLPKHELLDPGCCLAPECMGEAFSFLCLLRCSEVLMVEKQRDHDTRLQITGMCFAFKDTVNDVPYHSANGVHFGCPVKLDAYLMGLTRSKTAICSLWFSFKTPKLPGL